MAPAMREAIQGAAALGHALPGNIIGATIASNPVEQRISPSMLVDLRKVCVGWHCFRRHAHHVQNGNLTEHETLLREVVREAAALGLSVPTLSILYNLHCAVHLQTKQSRGLIPMSLPFCHVLVPKAVSTDPTGLLFPVVAIWSSASNFQLYPFPSWFRILVSGCTLYTGFSQISSSCSRGTGPDPP